MLMFFLFWIRHNIHSYINMHINIYIYTHALSFFWLVNGSGQLVSSSFQQSRGSNSAREWRNHQSGNLCRTGNLGVSCSHPGPGRWKWQEISDISEWQIVRQLVSSHSLQDIPGHSRTFHPAHMSRCGSASITKSQHQKVLGTGYPLFIT